MNAVSIEPDGRLAGAACWRADGTPVEPWGDTPRYVRAEDFVFSFKRIADFHNASNHYGAAMEGRIVGAGEFRKATERQEGLGENVLLSNHDPDVVDHFVANLDRYQQNPEALALSPSETIADAVAAYA